MDTRERILEAAGTLFVELGYARTTTRAIADAAGINEVTLFRHFGSKQNLLKEFVAQFNAAGFTGTFEQHLTGDYAQDIRHMARAQYEGTLASARMLRVMVCDMLEMSEIQAIALAGAQNNQAVMKAYFQRQIDSGVVRDNIPADALVKAFDSLFSASLLFEMFFGTSLTPDMDPKIMLDHLADIFVQGTRKASEGI